MTQLCEYGCGQEAKHQFKNGKWCCSNNISNCIYKIKEIKNILKINKKECKFCKKEFTNGPIKNHIRNCYLNPKNIKLCPMCNKPIKHYKINTTCSYSCANTMFRSLENHGNWINGKSNSHSICFKYHKKECVVCKEKLIVEAHHYDGNRKNNNIENLIPLCTTHHKYWHSEYRYLIKDKVEKFRNEFIKFYYKNLKK